MSRNRTAGQLPLCLAAALAVAVACGGTVTDRAGSSSGDPHDAPGGDDASGASGGRGIPAGPLHSPGGAAGSADAGGASAIPGCGASVLLEPTGSFPVIPPTMLVAVQRSLVGAGPDGLLFDTVVSALDRFAQDPDTTFTNLAVGVFPGSQWLDGAKCFDSSCLRMRSINFPLPAADRGILTLLEHDYPGDYPADQTPLGCAVAGMLTNASRATLVLVADGAETPCADLDADVPSRGDIHVVAIPTERQDPSRLAALTLPERLHPFAEAPGVDALVRAFADIRDLTEPLPNADAPCRYYLPDFLVTGPPVNPATVNVLLTQSDDTFPIAWLASAIDCGPGHGWYYDQPETPSLIFGCPETCRAMQAPGGYLQAQLGCVNPVVPH